MPDHITKLRNQRNYTAVLNIPKDCRELLGKRQYKKALGTDHRPTALKLARPIVSLWQKQIDTARQGKVSAVSGKIEQLKKLLIELKDDISAAEDTDEHLNLFHAQSAIEDEVAELLNTDLNEASEPEKIAYLTAIGERVLFDDGLDNHVAKGTVTKRTMAERVKTVRDFTDFVDGKPVERITQDDANAFQELMASQGKNYKTIQKSVSQLSSYYKDQWPKRANIFSGVAIHRTKQRKSEKRQAFTVEDLIKLRQAIVEKNDPNLLSVFDIARLTGMRIEEVCSLRIEDVCLKEGLFRIDASKTEAGEREVVLSTDLIPKVKYFVENTENKWLLPIYSESKYGSRSDLIGKRFGRLKTSLNYDGRFVFHSIRKAVATIFERQGVSELVAADLLGHSRGSATMSYGLYSTGSSIEAKREAISLLTEAQADVAPRMITQTKQLGS